MLINVSELLKSTPDSSLKKDIEIKPKRLDDNISLEKSVEGKVTLIRTSEGILAQFKINSVLNILCFCCACKYSKNIKINFDQEYIFTDKRRNSIINQEQDEFFVEKVGKLDIWPVIRQGIILSLPMKNLCKKSCKGLCQNCGQNLNKKTCKCDKNLQCSTKLKISSLRANKSKN